MGECLLTARGSDENRQIVLDGLKRRALKKAADQLETKLDAFEADMIQHCNVNHASATVRQNCRTSIAIRAKAREKRALKWQAVKDVALSAFVFIAFSAGMLWLTTWTYLPLYGAATYIVGGALLLFAQIIRTTAALQNGGGK